MRFITDLSKGILGTADVSALWTEIINHIPDRMLLKPDLKILSPACGHGTEVDNIASRMLKLNIDCETVKSSIYVVDKYNTFTNPMRRKGYVNVITTDFLEWEPDMKFDVIIGNPPYQDTTGQNTLYPKFYAKAVSLLKHDGMLAMITPPAIIPGLWGVKHPDGIKMPDPLRIDKIKVGQCVKKHFPGVASDFCYFVLTNRPDRNQNVHVVTDAGNLISSSPLFPKDTNNVAIAQSILEKCFAFNCDPYGVSSSDYGRRAVSDPNGKDIAVESISTTGVLKTRPITWIKSHSHYGKPKVMMPMYGKTAIIDYSHKLVSAAQEKVATGNLTGHNVMTVITESDLASESLISVLESRLQVFFNSVLNETRSPYINFLKNFVGVPLDKIYTDALLEQQLKLSTSEKEWLDACYPTK